MFFSLQTVVQEATQCKAKFSEFIHYAFITLLCLSFPLISFLFLFLIKIFMMSGNPFSVLFWFHVSFDVYGHRVESYRLPMVINRDAFASRRHREGEKLRLKRRRFSLKLPPPNHMSNMLESVQLSTASAVKTSVRVTRPMHRFSSSTTGMRCTCVVQTELNHVIIVMPSE